jgi:DNA-binding NtrC family response regulator
VFASYNADGGVSKFMTKVLIADDEAQVTTMLEVAFRQAGFETKVCNTIPEVLGAMQDFLPHIVIIDDMVRGDDIGVGIRIAEAIFDQETPVITISVRATSGKVPSLPKDLKADYPQRLVQMARDILAEHSSTG